MRLRPFPTLLAVVLTLAGCSDAADPDPSVGGGAKVEVLRASHGSTCALTEDGATYCWGNPIGAFTCDSDCATSPTAVPQAPVLRTLALGGHKFGTAACGLDVEGTPHCWGQLFVDQDAAADLGARPTPLANGLALQEVAVGYGHICGTVSDGTARCWGDHDGGRRGQGTPTPGGVGTDFVPNAVAGARSYHSLLAGFYHTCGIGTDGRTDCWGEGSQLGNPAAPLRNSYDECGYVSTCSLGPVAVATDRVFESLGVRRTYHGTCGVTSEGEVYCWGAPTFSDAAPAAPERLDLGRAVVQIVGGESHTCVLGRDGIALCWGANDRGQLGTGGGDTETPTPVAGEIRFRELAAGEYHTCGITTQETVYCWGANESGQAGVGTRTDVAVPARVVVGAS